MPYTAIDHFGQEAGERLGKAMEAIQLFAHSTGCPAGADVVIWLQTQIAEYDRKRTDVQFRNVSEPMDGECPEKAHATMGVQLRHECSWQVHRQHGHEFQTCSYCGSLNPEQALKLLQEGAAYSFGSGKVYIDVPRWDAGEDECVGMGGAPGEGAWVKATEEHRAIIERTWSRESASKAISKGEGVLIRPAPPLKRVKLRGSHIRHSPLRPEFDAFFGFTREAT